jgi:hypothetical protein
MGTETAIANWDFLRRVDRDAVLVRFVATFSAGMF